MSWKKFTCLFLVFVMLGCFLAGCNSEEELDARGTYEAFFEISKRDTSAAFEKYGYFLDDASRTKALESYNYTADYEILEWRQLSDQLWVVIVELRTYSNNFNLYGALNFVALIDGEYKVINNIRGIPENLKEGVDLTKYEDYYGKEYEERYGIAPFYAG